MIQQTNTLSKSFTAGGAITKNAIVMFGADDNTVVVATAATDKLLGVALAAAASGERVEVQLQGVAEVALGGTVARGADVPSGAAGVGGALAAAIPIKSSVGRAMASGVSGDIIPVALSVWSAVTA
ncbi:MAG: capsid cement protein [Planctomycetota bacterium]